jgi:MIP family channel proteins
MRSTLRPLAAEFLGTFGFVFVGAGVVVTNTARNDMFGLGGIAFAQALAYAVMITATMRISGGHLNPAVTFAVWMAGRIKTRLAALYVVTQLVAAVVAVLCVGQLFPAGAAQQASFGVPRIAQDITLTQAVLLEAVLTLCLVSAVFGTVLSRHAPQVGGFAIGLVLLFGILVAGPLTGAALNPARAFGPALVALDWHGHLAYWIGPLLGAAVAAFLWGKLLLPLPGDPEP